MTINLSMPKTNHDLRPRITVVGVGGAGGNAVNNMIRANLEGVNFVICNTDAQALEQSLGDRKIQLGVEITRGLGAGSRPDVGKAAAEEALEEILDHISASHMVFITAGMGGGTGTGAAPVIAQAAREQGILTVGVVTKPFQFEGTQRMSLADEGIEELQQYVDTLLIIPNQNLFRIANEKTTFADAFKMADDVLHSGVRGVTDLMIKPGLINLDFADIRTIMSEMGKAMMGTGEAEGDKRAIDAAEAAISNPLLDDVTMKGARGVLINITGGDDMTLFEVDEAANRIREEVFSDALIIFGSTFDESMSGKMRVSMVATGIDADESEHRRSTPPGLTGPIPSVNNVTENFEQATPSFSDTPKISDNAMAGVGEVKQEKEELYPSGSPIERKDVAPSVDTREPFIPPRPTTASVTDETISQAEPFAAAAIENASADSEQVSRRGLTLFERMTGAGRSQGGKQPIAERTNISDANSIIQNSNSDVETKTTNGPEQSVTQSPAVQESYIVPANQPALKGFEAANREPATPSEEEMLEIPAFLRRQAN